MNRSTWVPLLTKEGLGEVLQWRVSNLPLVPSFVRFRKEGVHPADRRHSAVSGLMGKAIPTFQAFAPGLPSSYACTAHGVEGGENDTGWLTVSSADFGLFRIADLEPEITRPKIRSVRPLEGCGHERERDPRRASLSLRSAQLNEAVDELPTELGNLVRIVRRPPQALCRRPRIDVAKHPR
jgi:hypothetical protein